MGKAKFSNLFKGIAVLFALSSIMGGYAFAQAPGVPSGVIAVAADSIATVSFTPSASGGSASSFTVTASPGGATASGLSPPLILTCLTNGVVYSFTVTATNGSGTSAASTASNTTTPSAPPGAPTAVSAVAGNGSAAITFAAPVSDGGTAITSYAVTSSPSGFSATGIASPLTVLGLTNGVAYTFTVVATNAIGPGTPSSPSNSVKPFTVPGAPSTGVATSGDQTATVSFTAPASDGGSPITGYTATATDGVSTFTGVGGAAATSITVSGLTNGTSYTLSVKAANLAGAGAASVNSNAVIPATVPGAPTAVSAIAGNQSATVSFTPPVNNGGFPITGYTVTSLPSGLIATGASSPLVVNGLVNGVAYTFTVIAINAKGNSVASVASASVTPATVPGAPMIGLAAAGNQIAIVSFTAPGTTGGSAITGYTVTSSPGGLTATGSASPLTVAGLINGTAYTFSVVATNSVGSGLPSLASNTITPATVPSAPTIGAVIAGNASVSVNFTPPASSGGQPVMFYTVTSNPSNLTATGTSAPITVSGLVNGQAYAFTVTATNILGTSPPSAASSTVSPLAGLPGAPIVGTAIAGNQQATVSFSPPASNGGSAITGYIVTSNPGGLNGAGATSPIVVSGLANGTSYTFTVVASNIVGGGASSTPSNSVTPATVPGAPLIGTATAGNGSVSVAFTVPGNGGSAITSYTAISTPSGLTATGTVSPLVVTGLVNGNAYTFTVTATNSVGAGPASAASNSATPFAVAPGAPTIGSATPGNQSATINFTAPSSNGGSPITGYTVTSAPGGLTAIGSASPLTVAGLTNGTSYTFTVIATNIAGPGLPSAASNSVIPATVPGAPTVGTAIAGNVSATVSFTPPGSNGGRAITGYSVIASPGGLAAFGVSSPIIISGLNAGTLYTFTVVASNAVGNGPPSSATNAVTPLDNVPNSPRSVTAVAANSAATVTFIPPVPNGGSAITKYTVTSSPGGVTANGTGSPLLVSSLTNGTVYNFTVTATNAVGTGSPSAPSNSVTPASPLIISSAAATTFNVGVNGKFTVTVGGSISPRFALTGTLPTGVKFSSETGVLSGVPASGTVADYPLAITVIDGGVTSTAQLFTLTVARGEQIISFTNPGTRNLQSSPVTALIAISSSGRIVTLTSLTETVCSVSGNAINLLTTGACTVQASADANSSYSAAAPVTQTFAVANTALQQPQTIVFNPLSNLRVGAPTIVLAASGGASRNPVLFFTTTPSVCAITGNMVTITDQIGACSIIASQAGNTNYLAATPVTQNFLVTASTLQPLSQRGGIDIDGNGLSSLVLRSSTGALQVGRLVNFNFQFSPQIDLGPSFRTLGALDFAGTGKSDLVFQNIAQADGFGEVRILNNFLPNTARVLRTVRRTWDVQAVGDLDGDGLGDLVWRYIMPGTPDTGVSYIWFTDGNSVTQVRKRGGAPLDWTLLGAADLNNDGAVDMIYISPANQIRTLMATPSRTCANLSAGMVPAGFFALKVSDFTGNGRGDILVRNPTTGQTGLVSLDARGLTLPAPTADPDDRNASCTTSSLVVSNTLVNLPNSDPSWQFYASGDFNGDGVMDIVFRKPDNTLVLWLMNRSSPSNPTILMNAGTTPLDGINIQP